MATSSPAVAAGPFGSASTIVAGAVSSYHLLKIVGYSRTKEVLNGKSINSQSFQVGGHNWHAMYYPNGKCSSYTEFVSIYVHLDDTVAEAVNAQAKFSLLDQDGMPVPSYTKTTDVKNFPTDCKSWGYHNFIKRGELEKSEHLKDDSFTIRIDITIMKKFHAEGTPFVVVPPCDLHQNFGDILSSKERADVKFMVGRRAFAAHRLVLAARSPVFKAELFGLMKESTTSKVIRIHDMKPEVFKNMLTYIYTGAFPGMKQAEVSAMTQHLLVAADRYALVRLKLMCEDRLCRHIDTGSVVTMLALAEQHNCRGLKEACLVFLSSPKNLDAVMETKEGFEYLTKSYPGVLKELIVSTISSR